MVKELEQLIPSEAERDGTVQTADQKVQGNLINLDKYPAGGNEEEADDHRQDALTGPAGARGLGCADLKRSFPS